MTTPDVIVFDRPEDNEGFLDWKKTNQDGWYLNVKEEKKEFTLHRADCRHYNSKDGPSNTSPNWKVCTLTKPSILAKAEELKKRGLKDELCGTCRQRGRL